MIDHERILQSFESRFPVATVARYAGEGLALPKGRAFIFVPDCHLLTPEDAVLFEKNHFVLDAEILELTKGLRDLKKAHRGELTVLHLGDLFDVWRSRSGVNDKARVDAISAAYAEVIDLLRDPPPSGVRAEILAGNHDYVLHDLDEWWSARFRIIENEDRSAGDVLILHGDVFVWLENFAPDQLQQAAVRVAKWVSAGRHQLAKEQEEAVADVNRALPFGDRPIGAPKARLGPAASRGEDPELPIYNVIEADKGSAEAPNKRFFEPARKLANALKKHGHEIRTVVVGHTHWARIIRGEREPGVPFVVMDCGAWFGQCMMPGAKDFIWSAQIGVLHGNDLRLYQLQDRKA